MLERITTFFAMAVALSRGFGRWYTQQTVARPWTTAIFTGTTIVSASDITAQALEGNGGIDITRLSALAAYGGLYAGAGHKVLYAFLERVVPQHWSLMGRVGSQMALSQFVHTPLIQLPVFYGLTGWARGYDRQRIEANLRETYQTTLVRNYIFWLPTTGLMYAVVPLHLRVLVMNSASYFWNTGLSLSTQAPTMKIVVPPGTSMSIAESLAQSIRDQHGITSTANSADVLVKVAEEAKGQVSPIVGAIGSSVSQCEGEGGEGRRKTGRRTNES